MLNDYARHDFERSIVRAGDYVSLAKEKWTDSLQFCVTSIGEGKR
jgi:ABC-type microcin C transport system permease subunit YejB